MASYNMCNRPSLAQRFAAADHEHSRSGSRINPDPHHPLVWWHVEDSLQTLRLQHVPWELAAAGQNKYDQILQPRSCATKRPWFWQQPVPITMIHLSCMRSYI